MSAPAPYRLLKIQHLTEIVTLKKSAVYDRLNKDSPRFDASFPRPIHLGKGKNSSVAWEASEVDAWVASQVEAKRAA